MVELVLVCCQHWPLSLYTWKCFQDLEFCPFSSLNMLKKLSGSGLRTTMAIADVFVEKVLSLSQVQVNGSRQLLLPIFLPLPYSLPRPFVLSHYIFSKVNFHPSPPSTVRIWASYWKERCLSSQPGPLFLQKPPLHKISDAHSISIYLFHLRTSWKNCYQHGTH